MKYGDDVSVMLSSIALIVIRNEISFINYL